MVVQIVFLVGIQQFIYLRSVPDESENFTSKNKGPFIKSPKQNFSFVGNCPNDVIKF
jgi:hypothetical protein